jgi:hypothetical protein
MENRTETAWLTLSTINIAAIAWMRSTSEDRRMMSTTEEVQPNNVKQQTLWLLQTRDIEELKAL